MTNPNDIVAPFVVPASNEFHQHNYIHYGLSKREYFAAMAMQGILAHPDNGSEDYSRVAEWAIGHADGLITKLNEDPS